MPKLNSSMRKMKATPTSYKGQNFKSKSEAIFARWLDLCQLTWEYEPLDYSFESYVPDFKVIYKSKGLGLMQLLIEYKPCSPSLMYLHKFENYVCYLDKINHSVNTIPLIVYGNLFQSPVQLMDISFFSENLCKELWHEVAKEPNVKNVKSNKIYSHEYDFNYISTRKISIARKYRFDLNQ